MQCGTEKSARTVNLQLIGCLLQDVSSDLAIMQSCQDGAGDAAVTILKATDCMLHVVSIDLAAT